VPDIDMFLSNNCHPKDDAVDLSASFRCVQSHNLLKVSVYFLWDDIAVGFIQEGCLTSVAA
jgi:hypothetical protein